MERTKIITIVVREHEEGLTIELAHPSIDLIEVMMILKETIDQGIAPLQKEVEDKLKTNCTCPSCTILRENYKKLLDKEDKIRQN